MAKTIISQKSALRASKKNEAQHTVEEETTTLKNTIERQKYTESKIGAFGDYAQSHARLSDAILQQIRAPEREAQQGLNAVRPDLPKPGRTEPPRKERKGRNENNEPDGGKGKRTGHRARKEGKAARKENPKVNPTKGMGSRA